MSDQRLNSGQIADTTLTTIYPVPANSNVRIYSLILTNTTANAVDVSVFVDDGASRLIKSLTLPAGSGQAKSVFELVGALSGGDQVQLQAGSSDAFNYLLTGRLV